MKFPHPAIPVLPLLVILALACPARSSGQDAPSTAGSLHSPNTVAAVRVPDGSITLDGMLDEAGWRAAQPTSTFRQKEPVEGAAPLERTEVRVAYDNDALYIGARMFVRNRDSIQAIVSRRDNVGNSERILFSIDTYRDNRTAYTFGITATGVRLDYYHGEDEEFARDYTYDPVWEAGVSIDSTSWYAELRIPFSQLRFNDRDAQVWGLNMNRYIPSTNEDIYWVVIPKNATGWSSRFGTITGIAGIKPHRPVELTPYVAGEALLRSSPEPGNPFAKGDRSARAGLDMKMGLGSALTLDATINPDFGQVEADPAEVNLTAYETFFSERRPFFTEGAQLLSGSGPSYFYSRRIGAAPHGPAQGDFVDRPKSTSILGAAKVSGRLASGLSIAALSAVTSREYADTWSAAAQRQDRILVEPLAGYAVARGQQEFGANASTVGAMFTAVQRDLGPDNPLAAMLSRRAFSGGADWNLRFDDGNYALTGFAGMSHVNGTKERILLLQRSSARYFQRPDASHVRVDSARTSLTGYAAALSWRKNGGEHWLYSINGSMESPEFEINDAGSVSSVDNIDASSSLTYRETAPGSWYHAYSVSVNPYLGWNYGGVRRYTGFNFSSSVTWRNFWSSWVTLEYDLRAMSDGLTRGGPLMETPAALGFYCGIQNNYASPTQWNANFNSYVDELGTGSWSASSSITIKPSGRLQLSLGLSYNRSDEATQYVATIASALAPTYGHRYIFSRIDRSTLSMNLRANYAFTPDLTIEVYAEPFAASGRYHEYGELAAAGSINIRRYGTDGTTFETLPDGSKRVTDRTETFDLPNGDFNVLSFRSNVVLRWEWLRGSTLFFVWQQNRYSFDPAGGTVRPFHVFDALGTAGDQFVAVKVSCWLPVG